MTAVVYEESGSFHYKALLLAPDREAWKLTMPAYEVGANEEHHSWRSTTDQFTDLRDMLEGVATIRFISERPVSVETTSEGVLYHAGPIKLLHSPGTWTMFMRPGAYITKRGSYVEVPVTEEDVANMSAILSQWKEVPRG